MTAHKERREIRHDLLKNLAVFLRESEQILTVWDNYSDEHTDLDGYPHDEDAYAARRCRRDADMWRSFERNVPAAKALVTRAERAMGKLPGRVIQPRWMWQLATLHATVQELNTLRENWAATLDTLPLPARPGAAEYDSAFAEHTAEAWSLLEDWSSHGQAILDIHTAARRAPLMTTPAPPRAPLPQAAGSGWRR